MKREPIIQGFPLCAALLILLVLTSGCAGPTVRTYSGDKLPESGVAVIKGWHYVYPPLGYSGCDILSIDDRILNSTKVEVLPGWHELVIRDYSFSIVALVGAPARYARAALNFEAGHEYKIRHKGMFVDAFEIVDVTTGATILSQSWPSERQQTWVHFSAHIEPASGKELTWSEDEVNTIREVITNTAQRYGLKQEKTEKGYIASYTLPKNFFGSSGKDFDMDLKAYHIDPRGWGLNTKDQRGTIVVDLVYYPGGPIIYLTRQCAEVESAWEEMYELLHKKFGNRLTRNYSF